MKYARRTANLGTETAFAVLAEVQQLQRSGRSVVNLGIGDPDFDTAAHISQAAVDSIRAGRTHYAPSAGDPRLREAIAGHLARTRGVGYDPEEVVVTPGAKPILFFALMAIAEPGDEVIYPNPGFPIYESMIRYAGATPIPAPLLESSGFRFDSDDLHSLAGPNTRMIILNSPSNPTGGVLTQSDLQAVAEIARERNCWVLADEIYSEFLFGGRHESIAALDGMRDRTILLDGFSKTYAMTGWRLGYAAMPRQLADHISRLVTNSVSCTAPFVQDAGVAALEGPQDCVRGMISEFRTRRDLTVAALNEIPGVSCQMPGGAFYAYPNVTEACARTGCTSAEEFQKRLLHEAGVAVLARNCFGPRTEGESDEYVRVSFATSRELLSEGVQRIRQFVQDAN